MARDVGQRGDAGETRFLTDSGPVTERRSHTVVSSECLVTGPVRTLSQAHRACDRVPVTGPRWTGRDAPRMRAGPGEIPPPPRGHACARGRVRPKDRTHRDSKPGRLVLALGVNGVLTCRLALRVVPHK